MQRIGIMGGTFDPIHYGHLVTAEQAHYQFNLDKVVFVPSGLPPHKVGKHITSPGHRHMMTVLATTSNPHFEVSSIEVDRVGPSYTIDTVRAFRDRYGDEAGLYFITGADAILEMLEWKDSDTLLELCEFIAATRPGYALHNGRRQTEYTSSKSQRWPYHLRIFVKGSGKAGPFVIFFQTSW